MARYKIDCCQDCEKRVPGCHGSCEVYQTQRAELNETKAEKRKEYEIKIGLDRFMFDCIERSNKRNNYRGKYKGIR